MSDYFIAMKFLWKGSQQSVVNFGSATAIGRGLPTAKGTNPIFLFILWLTIHYSSHMTSKLWYLIYEILLTALIFPWEVHAGALSKSIAQLINNCSTLTLHAAVISTLPFTTVLVLLLFFVVYSRLIQEEHIGHLPLWISSAWFTTAVFAMQ